MFYFWVSKGILDFKTLKFRAFFLRENVLFDGTDGTDGTGGTVIKSVL